MEAIHFFKNNMYTSCIQISKCPVIKRAILEQEDHLKRHIQLVFSSNHWWWI